MGNDFAPISVHYLFFSSRVVVSRLIHVARYKDRINEKEAKGHWGGERSRLKEKR